MFYEDRVTSVAGLKKRLTVLDQDSGVRLVGRYGGKRALVFVTRFGLRYTIMTYSVGIGGFPGRKLGTMEVNGVEAAEGALKELLRRPLQAWIY
ncbi:MAG: hypothetical protein JRN21_01455 [Nitrososphaerota archaeon]|nr:hypothetical protein [Nitrososphaerota archaeon]